MSVSNPFINNCKLIRNFFDSALLLIICVLLFCCACADIFLIYTLNSPVTILVPLIAELFPSALLFAIYMRACRGKNISGLIKAAAVCFTVISAVLLLLCGSVMIMTVPWFRYAINPAHVMSLIYILSLAAVFITYAITLFSAGKSTRSIYIYRYGAKSAAAAAVIFAIIMAFALVTAAFAKTFDIDAFFNGNFFTYFVPSAFSKFLICISLALKLSIAVCAAVFALKYNSYIKKLSVNISLTPVRSRFRTDSAEEKQAKADVSKKKIKYFSSDYDTSAKAFTEKPKNFADKTGVTNKLSADNCPMCGATCDRQAVFCNTCGVKIR